MGKLLYLGIFLASLDPTYERASDETRRALMETDMMKTELRQLQDDAEKQLFNYTGLTKDELAYAGYAYPLFAGKVSTKPFKNFKYETQSHFTIIPELEYSFQDKRSTVFLSIIKEF